MAEFVLDIDSLVKKRAAELATGISHAADSAAYMDSVRRATMLRLEKARVELAESHVKLQSLNDYFSEVMYYRNLAHDCETAGDLLEAACNLEKAIIYGKEHALNPHNYLAAHERLFVLYRKLKKYSAEERAILDAINLESQFDNPICKRRVEKYKARLVKCRLLIEKNKNNE